MQIWWHDGDFALSHLSIHSRHLREPSRTPDDAYVSLALIAALFGEIQPKPPHDNGVRYYTHGAYPSASLCLRQREAKIWPCIMRFEGSILRYKNYVSLINSPPLHVWGNIIMCVFIVLNKTDTSAFQSFINASTVSLLINYYPLHCIHYINLIF